MSTSFISFGSILRSGWPCHRVILYLTFFRTTTWFHRGFIIIHSHLEHVRVPISPHPPQHWLFSIALSWSNLSILSWTACSSALPSPPASGCPQICQRRKPRSSPVFSEHVSGAEHAVCTRFFADVCGGCSETCFLQTSFSVPPHAWIYLTNLSAVPAPGGHGWCMGGGCQHSWCVDRHQCHSQENSSSPRSALCLSLRELLKVQNTVF